MAEVKGTASLDWHSTGYVLTPSSSAHSVSRLRSFSSIIIEFEEPVPNVTPGQVCSIYFGEWCLGSGIIEQTWTEDEELHDPLQITGQREEKSTGWIEAGRIHGVKSVRDLKKGESLDRAVKPPDDGISTERLGDLVDAPGFYVKRLGIDERPRKKYEQEAMRSERGVPVKVAIEDESSPQTTRDVSAFSLYYDALASPSPSMAAITPVSV